MKVLVIGGSGFIGTRLCKRLRGIAAVKFVILDKQESEVFPGSTLICDIEDYDDLERQFPNDIDLVINLAAEHKDNIQPKSRYHDVNVIGQQNICSVMQKKGIKRHIFTSSVAVYGFVTKETFEDGSYQPFHEYGQSKLDAEKVLDKWYESGAEQHSVIRPTVVFGEGNRGNVYNLLRQIASGKFLMIGDGANRKSMAYVENVAAFIEFLILNGDGYQVFNYVDKPDFNMNELYLEVNKALGKRPKSIRIPYFLGLLAGYAFDFLSVFTRKEFPISAIRVKKFCGTTQFGSINIDKAGFKAPISVASGLAATVEAEFKK
ncbi:NAD-dependent epimerase/dehydratase family protein [Marinagarivorans algicola]|uniref:NAD-dependent epimerase/dehydratase family protein n=1 Tax=Marinagarivorans algicola TaxID=1513270 RepID=UPI0006B926AD|nr:NAD-dependent epimerase/dehydratase family protein [Marinagarivorans algicola]